MELDALELDATLRAAATAVTPAPRLPTVKDDSPAQPFDYAAWMARLGEIDAVAEMPPAGEHHESASALFGRLGAPYLTEAALTDLAPLLQRHAEDTSHHADALPADRPTEQLAEPLAVHVATAASCGEACPAAAAHGVARLCTAAQDRSSTALHAEQAACASALQAEQQRLAEASEQGLLAERARGNAQATGAHSPRHPLLCHTSLYHAASRSGAKPADHVTLPYHGATSP